MSPKTPIGRRPLLASVLGVAGLAIIGGGIYEGVHTRARRYPHTAYDDLLYKLSDRESAKQLGLQVLSQDKNFDLHGTAQMLREKLKKEDLADVLEADIRGGAVMELRGWVIPQTLADLCALAAKAG
jgi:hypothetical protein